MIQIHASAPVPVLEIICEYVYTTYMKNMTMLSMFAAIAFGLAASAASAAELIFVERAGCPYCIKWEREIAPSYALTKEGKLAKLRKVDLGAGQPTQAARPVRFTPTFLVINDGKEVGRITGYSDEAMFWGMLSQILARLEPVAAPADAPAAVAVAD
jgi:hypothetical protein